MTTHEPDRPADHRTQDARVVAALDGSPADDAVVDWAADEASRSGDALHLVHVIDTGMQFAPHELLLGEAPGFAEALRATGEEIVERAATRASARRPEIDVTRAVEWGAPAGVVVDHARVARLLVAGSRSRGRVERAILGSVALACIHHGRSAVVVVPTGTQVRTPRHVVVGVDGSPPSQRAADAAVSVAASAGAEVHCVVGWNVEVVDGTVVTEPGTPAWETVQHRYAGVARRCLEDAVSRHPGVRVSVDVRRAEPSRSVLDAAEEVDADLVVVGTRGFGGFRGLLLGSVAKRVLEAAGRVVLVTH